jgi:hypothetical protein
MHDPATARPNFEQSLALFRRCGDVEGIASVHMWFGGLLCEEGAWAEGLAMLRAAVATYTRLGMPQELGWGRECLEYYERLAPPGVAGAGGAG